jgi:hypothetical protein
LPKQFHINCLSLTHPSLPHHFAFASEAASLNSQFEFGALLAGAPSGDIIKGGANSPFDTINPTDVTAVQGDGTTPFDYLIYGVDPTKAALAGDPGSFELFNGAEVRFDDAFNVPHTRC